MTTLRMRLLVGLLTGITLILAATGVAVDLVVESHFRSELDRSLAVLLESNVATVIREAGRRAFEDAAPSIAIRGGRDRLEGRHPPSLAFAQHTDVLLQAWNSDGVTVARSDALGEADLPRLAAELEPVSVTDIDAAELSYADVELPTSGAPGRAVAVRFIAPPEGRRARFLLSTEHRGTWFGRPDDGLPPREFTAEIEGALADVPPTGPLQLVVAQDTGAMIAALSRLRWLLALGWLVSSLGCAGIVLWIVNRGLRPLDGLRRQMGTVQSADLQQDFALPDAPGELQPVVTQLNALMGRIRAAFVREQAFTSDVAHELRTPLAGLRSTLEVALSRPRDEPSYRKAAEASLAITLEMQSLVEVLLEMARAARAAPDGRAADLARAPLDDLVRECWGPFAREAERRGLGLDLQAPAGAVVRTDLPLFRRVLGNLLENAVSYAREGSRIEVVARPDAAGGLALSVANRVGEVPADLAERAFDAFWRADPARSATGRHAGLGLALCRRILAALGGRIGATCREGRFTVALDLPAA